MRESIKTALGLSQEELSGARNHLYQRSSGEAPVEANLSKSARVLSITLSRFLRSDIPGYWQKIPSIYYDHYVFQRNGHPVSAHPEQHAIWVRQETSLRQRCLQWLRFNRGLFQMMWRRKRMRGLVP